MQSLVARGYSRRDKLVAIISQWEESTSGRVDMTCKRGDGGPPVSRLKKISRQNGYLLLVACPVLVLGILTGPHDVSIWSRLLSAVYVAILLVAAGVAMIWWSNR